jgi:hypothetical protein
MTGNELRIGGSYWFSREFVVYLDEAEFAAAKAHYVKSAHQEDAQPVEAVVAEVAEEIAAAPVLLVAANDHDYEKPGANDDVYLVEEVHAAPVEQKSAPVEKKAKPVKAIAQLDDGNFFLGSRGNKMTLINGANGWEMRVDNALHRAYCGAGVRVSRSLQDVEKKYKSWRGISTLATEYAHARH